MHLRLWLEIFSGVCANESESYLQVPGLNSKKHTQVGHADTIANHSAASLTGDSSLLFLS